MAKHRTRVYEIEDIDEEAIADLSVLGTLKNFFLGRRTVTEVHHHDLHEFPHKIRIREISSEDGGAVEGEYKPLGERVREWFVGRGTADRGHERERLEHEVKEGVDRASEKGASVTSRAKSAVSEAIPSVSSAGSSVSSVATEVVHGGAQKVLEGAERLAGAVTSPIAQVVESAESVYHAATSQVSRAAEQVEDRAEEAVREAGRRLQAAGEAARDRVGNLVVGRSIGERSGSLIEQAPVTALYAALGTLALVWLMRRLWRQRVKTGVYLGDGTVEMIRETTSAARDVDGAIHAERETSAAPSLASPPPSPQPERTAAGVVPGAPVVEHTKVLYKRHSSLTKRQESVAEFAMSFIALTLLSLFAEASGMNRGALHLMWFTFAVAQVAYHAYGIEGTKDSHAVGPGRSPGLYGTWFALAGLALPVFFEGLRHAIRG